MLEEGNLASLEDFTHMGTLYNSWIGGEGMSLGHTLFYTLLPLLAVRPCGWCFTEELSSGYLHVVVPLCGRGRYLGAKMLASFIVGGMIAVIPQLASILLTALFIPAVQPNILFVIYMPINHGAMLSGLFYAQPLLYLSIIMVINFVFGGIYTWLSLAAALLTGKRMSAIILPFLLLLVGDMAKNLLLYISYLEISPLNILHPMTPSNIIKLPVVLGWMGILSAISVAVLWIKGGRYEIS